MNKKLLTYSWVLLLLDFFTKFWAENILGREIHIIPNILSLQYVQNTGIAFSIPLSWIILKIITVILIFTIFWYYWTEEKKKKSQLLDFSYALIITWAIGNGWERVFNGYVVDMISLEYFAVFNLADSYICIGAIGIIYYYYKNK